ncbi:sensor histidine kinase [Nonomuraea insulae]|uniref:histidine kinase n=1 Tax=Nonomuraea insulae TaxID=1616787 RepID=A0ABW1D8T3_9ACTN
MRGRVRLSGDVLLGAVLGLPVMWAGFTSSEDYRLAWWEAVAFLAGVAATVTLARRWPWAAMPAGVTLWVAAVVAGSPFVVFAAMAVPAYLAGVRGEGPRALAGAAGGAVLGVVAPVAAGDAGAWFVAVAGTVLGAVVPWLAGRARRQYVVLAREGWERAEELERAQRTIAEQARARERTRIAGDMHDLLGHELSLVALRIGGLEVAPGLAEPYREAAGEARSAVTAAARRLQDIVHLLREDADPASEEVPELVARARAAGLPVELRTGGDGPPAGAMAERALRRVVQEGLTNAAKHAPSGPVTVAVEHGEDGSTVTVTTCRGAEPARESYGGYGLEGLGERVRLCGGSLRAGPTDEGGFELRATLPRRPGPIVPSTSAFHLDRARRRAHRSRFAAVTTAVAATATVAALLLGFMVYDSVTSALSPAVFDGLRVGQEEAAVQAVLPSRTRVDGGRAGEPPGIRCRYYGTHPNPFDVVRGEMFRLCFRDGRLVAKDFLPHGRDA